MRGWRKGSTVYLQDPESSDPKRVLGVKCDSVPEARDFMRTFAWTSKLAENLGLKFATLDDLATHIGDRVTAARWFRARTRRIPRPGGTRRWS